jgi:hypothetical protein
VTRLLLRGILPGGPGRLYHFLASLPVLTPERIPLVVGDWIIGLSMRDYVERHLSEPTEAQRPDPTPEPVPLRAEAT